MLVAREMGVLTMRLRRSTCSAVVGLVVLLAAAPAAAETHDDANDVPGRLDLRQVTRTFTNGPAAPPFVHLQATTYPRWTLRQCQRADACSFTFAFDSRQGPGADVIALWDVGAQRRPECTVLNLRTQKQVATGDAAKFRHSAFCSFPKRVLKLDKPVRWRVHSLWGNVDDAAPDSGWF
jgi:hypothetical protein